MTKPKEKIKKKIKEFKSKMSLQDKIKYISFLAVLVGTVLWYVFDPGLNLSDMGQGWIATAVIIAVGVLICLSMGVVNGKRNFDNNPKLSADEKSHIKRFFKSVFLDYFIWGTVQQAGVFLIYAIVSIFTEDYNIVITSIIFGMMHFPNPILLFSTFGFSGVLMQHFEACNNVLGAYLAHGLIASVLMFYLPDPINTSWQAWRPYWRRQRKLNKLNIYKK